MSDLIDRHEAIDAVVNKCTDIYVGNLPAMADKKEVCSVLQELSPVTPKQKVSISEIRNQVAGEPVDLFTELTDEEKKQNKWYVQGYTDAMKPKTGKWIEYDGDWLKTMCKCSECGAMIDINEKYRNFFCYHCGARMDGEQDED